MLEKEPALGQDYVNKGNNTMLRFFYLPLREQIVEALKGKWTASEIEENWIVAQAVFNGLKLKNPI